MRFTYTHFVVITLRHRSALLLKFACVLLLLYDTSANAQLRLPRIDLPALQQLNPLESEIRQNGRRLLTNGDVNELLDRQEMRLKEITQLLQRHANILEADPLGAPMVRYEILAWSPTQESLAIAIGLGLRISRTERLEEFSESLVVLRLPSESDTANVLQRLRQLDPQGIYDFNHLYLGSDAENIESMKTITTLVEASPSNSHNPNEAPIPIGLIDGGVDLKHRVFANVPIQNWGCEGKSVPSMHGTAVAALMAGQSRQFQGVLAAAQVYSADIYCEQDSGGSVDKITAALAWLSKQKVGVINFSLVGPPNQTLERIIHLMIIRGHIIVAAVGNDGPAARPLYPASYPGVVGVSAVDKNGKSLPEAGRGAQVMFAAPGSQMVSASIGSPPYRQVRGTSFAAPIVAALLAKIHPHPDQNSAKRAIAELVALAKPTGISPNEVTGYGIVGTQYRLSPEQFR